ncbi:MAG: hypothetical protein JKX84_02040 [Flavobacteriales bacterium]|nr:hypothetical protein [Flavobacteriales bacterium]
MKIIHLNKERWEGSFIYNLEDDQGVWEGRMVNWLMEIDLDQDSFTGIRVDEETKEAFSELVTVEGFKEGDQISFIVKYPCNYYSDPESGEVILIPNEAHPGVRHTGEYDSKRKEYAGTWEVNFMDEAIGVFQEDYFSHNMVGTWAMKRTSK